MGNQSSGLSRLGHFRQDETLQVVVINKKSEPLLPYSTRLHGLIATKRTHRHTNEQTDTVRGDMY